jgi:hypothetical protein
MVREEITAGLQNAINRGESIEKAMQSMISAGYPQEEVQESSGYINMGTAGSVGAIASEAAQTAGYEAIEKARGEKPKKKKTGLVILLLIVLLLIVGGIFALFYFRGNFLA